jgi:transposase, IS30 family
MRHPTATKQYVRLNQEDREDIFRGISGAETLAEIALRLRRPTSTVSSEVSRNGGRLLYRPSQAERRSIRAASSRKSGKTKFLKHRGLCASVIRRLRRGQSPDQVSKRLAVDYPDRMDMRISPEAIYRYIYVLPRGVLKETLVKGLRQQHETRWKRKGRGEETRGKIAEMLSIEERPAEVADRIVPGHWEGDLIVGARGASAVATLVERVTRLTLIIRLKGRDAETVRKAMARAVSRLPKTFKKSLTYDQGKEMSEHKLFAKASGMTVYFAHPHSPWERGTNENTNGLIRQYFPKGTDFTKVTAAEIRRCQNLLNDRPRKVLEYHTPNEVFGELMKSLR